MKNFKEVFMLKANDAEWLEFLRLFDDESADERSLRMAAAMLGPGYKGKRVRIPLNEKRKAAQTILEQWETHGLEDPPAFLFSIVEGDDAEYLERRAKLFEIGAYEDKDLRVSQEDLVRLEKGFEFPVPIFVEHRETPLRLGYLTDVQTLGGELFGTLALTKSGNEIIEESQAKSLSLGVSKDFSKIFEVSIVANPRVESARLFCKNFHESETDAKRDEWRNQVLYLQSELKRKNIEEQIERFSRAGKITPASRTSAIELLESAERFGFGEKVTEFFASLPERVVFRELAKSGARISHELTPEESDFYSKHFSGLDLEEIAKRKVR